VFCRKRSQSSGQPPVVALVVRSAGGLRLTARPGRLDFARAPALFVFGAGTGACPYGCWFSIREAVGATPCGCPRRPHGWWFAFGQVPRLFGFRTDPRGICAAGQAQGPAPTVLMGPYSPWSTGISNRTATTASLPRARRKTRWTRRSESLPKRRWWRATLRLGQLDHFPVRVPCTCLRCGILSGKLRFTQDDGTWHRSVAKKVSPVPCQL